MKTKQLVGGLLLGTFVILLFVTLNLVSHRLRAAQEPPATPQEKWKISIGRSPMDDSRTVVLTLDSEDQIQGLLGAVKPSLIVRCKEKKTDVYVATGMAASIEEDFDGGPAEHHTVKTRLDNAPAIAWYWYESTDHKALFSGGGPEFAKELTRADTLTFQFTPFDGSPQVARFDIRGLDPHLHKVAEACGWAYY